MTKEGNNTTQNERLMVSVRVRPMEPFRETARAVAVLDSQTLLFSEPPPVDRSDPEHHYRTGTLFHSGASNSSTNGNGSLGGSTSSPPGNNNGMNRNSNNSRSNHMNSNLQTQNAHGHSQSLTNIPSYQNGTRNNPGSNNGAVETGKAYDFDWVFDETCSQEDVYKSTAAPLVRSVLEGFCATVFAYGATGSGKTHTMIGTTSNPGIMARAVDDIFHLCANQKKDLKSEVYLSYLEVYNEQIRDLLCPTPGVHLDLREDKEHVHVAGLSEIRATTTHEVLNLLQKGNRARTMEATAANITSSRSHAVLQVTVRQVSQRTGIIIEGKLYLIDLAGSERASNTKNSGVRLREGGHINRSLLALGNCITALASGDSEKYINYRDSKLTRLLKAALGGPSKTAMIAHISPGVQQREETRNTLLYARRARAISNRVKKFTYQGQVTDTNNIIQELRNEVKRLKLKLDQKDSSPSHSSTSASEHHDHSPSHSSSNPNIPTSATTSPTPAPISIPVPQQQIQHSKAPPRPPPPGILTNNSHSNNGSNLIKNSSHPNSSSLIKHNSHPSSSNSTKNKSTMSHIEPYPGKRDQHQPNLATMKQDIIQLFDEEFRLRNDLLKLDGAMLQSALDCEILRLMVLDWETLKIQRDSDGEATSEDSDNGKQEISSVMAELKQVRHEQDKLLAMRTKVEDQLKNIRERISQTEDDASKYLPDTQREVLSVLCKLQQEQVQKMSVEIEAELKRRGSLLLRCLRQKALGEAIIHRQRHFLNAMTGNPSKNNSENGSSHSLISRSGGRNGSGAGSGGTTTGSGSGNSYHSHHSGSGGSGNNNGGGGNNGHLHSSSVFLPPLTPNKSLASNERNSNERLHHSHSPPTQSRHSSSRSHNNHLPPLQQLPLSGIPKTTKYSEFRKSRLQRNRRSSSDEDLDMIQPAVEPPKLNLGRKVRVTSPDLRYKAPY